MVPRQCTPSQALPTSTARFPAWPWKLPIKQHCAGLGLASPGWFQPLPHNGKQPAILGLLRPAPLLPSPPLPSSVQARTGEKVGHGRKAGLFSLTPSGEDPPQALLPPLSLGIRPLLPTGGSAARSSLPPNLPQQAGPR